MTMGERKCFAIGQDGAKTEVPCGGGKGKGKPAAKAKLIHAILHRLQMAAARVHSLPTVCSLSLSLDSFYRNRQYPTHVPCSLMAGIQWPVCPYEYHHEMPYLYLSLALYSLSLSLSF